MPLMSRPANWWPDVQCRLQPLLQAVAVSPSSPGGNCGYCGACLTCLSTHQWSASFVTWLLMSHNHHFLNIVHFGELFQGKKNVQSCDESHIGQRWKLKICILTEMWMWGVPRSTENPCLPTDLSPGGTTWCSAVWMSDCWDATGFSVHVCFKSVFFFAKDS